MSQRQLGEPHPALAPPASQPPGPPLSSDPINGAMHSAASKQGGLGGAASLPCNETLSVQETPEELSLRDVALSDVLLPARLVPTLSEIVQVCMRLLQKGRASILAGMHIHCTCSHALCDAGPHFFACACVQPREHADVRTPGHAVIHRWKETAYGRSWRRIFLRAIQLRASFVRLSSPTCVSLFRVFACLSGLSGGGCLRLPAGVPACVWCERGRRGSACTRDVAGTVRACCCSFLAFCVCARADVLCARRCHLRLGAQFMFRVQDLGFRVKAPGGPSHGFRVQGSGFRV